MPEPEAPKQDCVAAGPREAAFNVVPEIHRLFRDVAGLCDEVGCACLARQFRCADSAHQLRAQPACANLLAQQHPALHLLAKLAPLTRALAAAGYFDLALATTELAMSFEPTLDLDIGRAYLLVVLGEQDAAWRIYRTVLQRQGSLPVEEVRRLAELADCHPGEDDIAELYAVLKVFARNPGVGFVPHDPGTRPALQPQV